MEKIDTEGILSAAEQDLEERGLKLEDTSFRGDKERGFRISDDWKQGVDVEHIMEEIREDVSRSGYSYREMSRARRLANLDANEEYGYDEAFFGSKVDGMRTNWRNPIYFPYKGNPVKVFFQTLIRKITASSFYFAFVHQNRFNHDTYDAVRQLQLYTKELEEECRVLREEVDQLKRKGKG
jgi:hypothetical protein